MKFNKMIPELDVINIEESLKFYKTIGFDVIYERKEDKFIFIELDEIQLMLQELTKNNKWQTGILEVPFGKGINFQLEIENVNDTYNKLIDNGYNIFVEIEENWYRQDNKLLGNKEFLVQDPNGYVLRLTEDLGEKEI